MLRLPGVISCFLAFSACSSITENVAALGVSTLYKEKPTMNDQLLAAAPRLNMDLYKSVQLRPDHRSDLAVAIAVSGGGHRAANLTTGVLLGLEKLPVNSPAGNLLREVDYYSTTSGGGFAVGLYLTYLHHQQYRQSLTQTPATSSFSDALDNTHYDFRKRLRTNFSNSLFRSYISSVELEKTLSTTFLQIDDTPPLTLGDMFIARDHPTALPVLPIWVPNATVMQNRQLFQFTPDVLQSYEITRYIHDNMIEDVRHKDAHRVYAADMPVAVGMMASATYPYAVAGTTLWSNACYGPCYLHLFDGGLVDNLGLFTALDLLRQDKAPKKLLILIDAFQGSNEPFSEKRFPPGKLDLLQSILLSSADVMQRNIKPHISAITKSMLCNSGAEQVIVVHLDLTLYQKTSPTSKGLWISEEAQQQLLKIGEQMVQSNTFLTALLPKMLNDKKTAHC